jgi:hypothetical protein
VIGIVGEAVIGESRHSLSPSFRGALKARTRNLEIPGSMLTHRPGMTAQDIRHLDRRTTMQYRRST